MVNSENTKPIFYFYLNLTNIFSNASDFVVFIIFYLFIYFLMVLNAAYILACLENNTVFLVSPTTMKMCQIKLCLIISVVCNEPHKPSNVNKLWKWIWKCFSKAQLSFSPVFFLLSSEEWNETFQLNVFSGISTKSNWLALIELSLSLRTYLTLFLSRLQKKGKEKRRSED